MEKLLYLSIVFNSIHIETEAIRRRRGEKVYYEGNSSMFPYENGKC